MNYHLAQINIGRLVAPLDDPKIAEFVAQLDPVNALADSAPGFVWRLQSDSGNATDIPYSDDPLVIVNMSVWESMEALRDFAYRSDHIRVFRDRAKWFEKAEKPNYATGLICSTIVQDPPFLGSEHSKGLSRGDKPSDKKKAAG